MNSSAGVKLRYEKCLGIWGNATILMKQQDNMERPSDIQGLLYIPFKDNLQKDAGPLLAKEMAAQGYPISLANL